MPTLRDVLIGSLNRRIPDAALPVGTVEAAGTYEPAFLSGSVQIKGADGTLNGLGDFQYGLNLPNASGISGPGLLLAGAGKVRMALICDEQLPGQKGIDLIIEAGDASQTAPATDMGGALLLFAGGALNGNADVAQLQGGTSVHAFAGNAVLAGGNTTDGTPGNAVCIGGQTGPVGAGVFLIMTKPPGSSTYGDVRIQANSTLLIQFLSNGEFYLTSSGTGAGLAGQPMVSGGIGAPAKWLSNGFTGTITTAKLTSGGAGGSMTFASGILTGQVAAT
jgi:hypothetical protein